MSEIVGLHHIAYAHHSGEALHELLAENLGLNIAHTETGDGFIERMIPIGGPPYVQTLEACGEGGVVERFVDKRGSALHHVAFQVDDLAGLIAELRSKGVRLIDEKPRAGGMGTLIAFVHPSSFSGLLVELVEVPQAEVRP